MNIPKWIAIPVLVVACLFAGFYGPFWLIKEGRLTGYHCQPITTHSTLEDAKAKVIEYQERVK